MKASLPLVTALMLVTAGTARERDNRPHFERGTPVQVVGEVSSPPKLRLGEQKLQVSIGPNGTDYTLHFFRAQVLDVSGRPLNEDGFKHGMWVRADGIVMNDPRRVKVSRLQVIAQDRAAFAHCAFRQAGREQGYITSVAGTRQTFAEQAGSAKQERITLRGEVLQVDPDQEYLTLRTVDRHEHRIWLPAAEIRVLSRREGTSYHPGDRVEVSIRQLR